MGGHNSLLAAVQNVLRITLHPTVLARLDAKEAMPGDGMDLHEHFARNRWCVGASSQHLWTAKLLQDNCLPRIPLLRNGPKRSDLRVASAN
jgi:hypothetical protein